MADPSSKITQKADPKISGSGEDVAFTIGGKKFTKEDARKALQQILDIERNLSKIENPKR